MYAGWLRAGPAGCVGIAVLRGAGRLVEGRSSRLPAGEQARLYELQPTTGDDGEPRPVAVRLSGGAKAAWKAYYNAHAVEQTDLEGDMAAAWSKLEEYAARLALVVHYVRWAAGGVDRTPIVTRFVTQ